MKWAGLLLSALLLFSFSPLLFSEVVLTDQEYDLLMITLDQSETELTQQETAINELKQELSGLKKEQKLSNDIINLLKMESSMLKESLKMRKSEQIIRDLKIFGVGLLTGLSGGIPAGIKIGIALD